MNYGVHSVSLYSRLISSKIMFTVDWMDLLCRCSPPTFQIYWLFLRRINIYGMLLIRWPFMSLMVDVPLNRLLWREAVEILFLTSCLSLDPKSTHTMYGDSTHLLRYSFSFLTVSVSSIDFMIDVMWKKRIVISITDINNFIEAHLCSFYK